jgi:hypothetical protein
VWILNLKDLQWSHPHPRELPAKGTFPVRPYFGSPVPVGENIVMARGGSHVYFLNLKQLQWRRKLIASDVCVDNVIEERGRRIVHGRAPVSRNGHTTLRVGYSIYVVGGCVEHRNVLNVFEQMAVLDLLGYEAPAR